MMDRALALVDASHVDVDVPAQAPLNRRDGMIHVVVDVDNHAHLVHAYNSAAASAVRDSVHDRGYRFCDAVGAIASARGDRLLLVFEATHLNQLGVTGDLGEALLLERIVHTLGSQPILHADSWIFAVVSASIIGLSDSPIDSPSNSNTCQIGNLPLPKSDTEKTWREQYAADMAAAWNIFHALEEGRLHLQYEPICDTQCIERVLYHEALLREAERGVLRSAGVFILALERLGLMRRIDQWVLTSVIDLLRINRTVRLGCNISAQSAVVDGWWASTMATLTAHPDIAARLTIEITESAPLADLKSAQYFVRTMQSLGCQVALDDVGAGFNNIETLLALSPDVVKIDRAYIRRSRSDARALDFLGHLLRLAASWASSVVVEGIETEEDLHAARSIGVTWGQGYRFSERAYLA